MTATLEQQATLMGEALRLAQMAEEAGEVPVGAVVVVGDEIVGFGHNSPIGSNDPSAHAEMLAIRKAARHCNNYRLENASLYVTLEPCIMCAGAIVNARIAKVYFGARDLRFGALRSKFQLADHPLLNHRAEIVEGVRAAECTELLRRFFETRRSQLALNSLIRL